MKRTIKIVIGLDGSTRVETKGFKGQTCEAVTKELEEALGSREKNQRTAEFFEKPQHNQLRNNN